MKKRTLFHLLLAISVSGNILAGNAHERCKDDQLSQSAAQGRIAWAKKCGLIDDIDSNYYLAKKKYPVFNEKNAPTDPNAPCENLTPLADCVFGCYPGHQKVLFSDGFIPIATAYTQDKMEGLFSLSKFAHLDNLFFKENKISHYTIGSQDATEEVLVIHTEDGQRLEVTLNHPMVKKDGEVVDAQDLRVGQSLLHYLGYPTKIVSLETYQHTGKVWNVDPQSEEPLENIIVAEELLTGSARYQNEWAGDHSFRLSLRKKALEL